MELKQLIRTLAGHQICSAGTDFEVEGVGSDSQSVKDNFIFVAIKGNRADGNKFIPQAIEKGARAVVASSFKSQVTPLRGQASQKGVWFIVVPDTRQALAQLAAEFYGHPSEKIKVVGITGTNGKTTISYLIEAILKEAGFNPAVIGTVNYRFNGRIIPSQNTTPGSVQMQLMLADMLRQGINYLVTEVSSHALHQQRTAGIKFHCAIFTNLTQDHLDYHKTMEDYFEAKAILFRHLAGTSCAIVNNDDIYGRRLEALTAAEITTYGIDNPADFRAGGLKLGSQETEFVLSGPSVKMNLKSRLIGRHNVYNILAAAGFALKEGISPAVLKSVIEKFYFIPGRLERIESQKGFSVFVDYAHTEDALKNVIGSLRPLAEERIIVVFGCGGERDKTKRPKMGRVVSELADYAIITSDNPRSEDPLDIIKDIKEGIKKDNYSVVPDRLQAIRESLALAEPGDIVLIAGKGHESSQVLKDKVLDFDDREVVRQCLGLAKY